MYEPNPKAKKLFKKIQQIKKKHQCRKVDAAFRELVWEIIKFLEE